MEIVRKYLSEDEGAIPNTRYNPDTDTVETSVNGTDWVENEAADPRSNPAYMLDPGSNVRCGAADGMRIQIAEWALTASAYGFSVGLANALLTSAIALLPGIGWMFLVFWGVANAAVAIGGATIGGAFTESVLRQIKCILLTCLEPDGTITEAGLARARAGVAQQINDAVVTACFDLMITSWGYVGFSNAGIKYYNAGADCECDECPVTYTDNMTTGVGWRTLLKPTGANAAPVWQSSGGYTGEGCVVAQFNASAGYQATVWVDLGQDCYVQQAHFKQYKPNATTSYFARFVRVYNEAGAQTYAETVSSGNVTGATWFGYSRTIGLAVGRYVEFIGQGGTAGGAIRMDDFVVVTS